MDIRNPTPRHPSKIEHYPGGQTLPTPKATDFKPGALLGSVSSELDLRKYLASNGRTLVVTADKDGPGSVFARELPDADVVISQPFWPAYLTADRIAQAKRPKLAITARHRLRPCRPSGRDRPRDYGRRGHLQQFDQRLRTCRDDDPGAREELHAPYQYVVKGGWNIAECVTRSYDVEGMHVGTVAAGRIGLAVLRRLKPFDRHLHPRQGAHSPLRARPDHDHGRLDDDARPCDDEPGLLMMLTSRTLWDFAAICSQPWRK